MDAVKLFIIIKQVVNNLLSENIKPLLETKSFPPLLVVLVLSWAKQGAKISSNSPQESKSVNFPNVIFSSSMFYGCINIPLMMHWKASKEVF